MSPIKRRALFSGFVAMAVVWNAAMLSGCARNASAGIGDINRIAQESASRQPLERADTPAKTTTVTLYLGGGDFVREWKAEGTITQVGNGIIRFTAVDGTSVMISGTWSVERQ